MRAAVVIACVVWITLLAVGPGHAERRVALVMGNANYRNAAQLANPINDATAMAALLRSAGFEVSEPRLDLGIAEMRRAISDFSETARDSDIAIVYFAGHGIEVDGVNYLIPIDATLARDFDVEDETVSLDRVLRAIGTARRLRLVILDACRDNPFVQSMRRGTRAIGRGLARIEPSVTDTLVAFAAKAGSTASDGGGEHSPFTAALLQHIATPGLDIRLALGEVRDAVMANTSPQQEPFVYGSLGGRTISLVDAPQAPANQLSPAVPQGLTIQCAEAARSWRDVKDTTSIAVLEAFVRRYGDCFYADLANLRITQLKEQQALVVPPALPPVQRPPPEPPPARPAPAPRPVTLLNSLGTLSRWAIGSSANCNNPRSFYSLELGAGVITWRNGLGNTDIESVVSSGATEFHTTTQTSIHVDNKNEKTGQTWTYTKAGGDRIWVTPGGRSPFLLIPCS
jgi:uncharacterized caspase-like protein